MSDKVDFRIRYQVPRNTPNGTLLGYLRSNETEFPTRHMVLWSLAAFWRPLACQWSGRFSEDRLQAIARLSIGALQQHIEYLACTFGLEQELLQPGGLLGGDSHPTMMPAAVPEPSEPAPASKSRLVSEDLPQPDPEEPQIIWGNPEDDALLDQMFK